MHHGNEEKGKRKPGLSFLLCLTTAYVFNFLILRAENVGLEFWFQTLQKPGWTLPTVLFAPVWTLVSGMIGLAGWQVYEADASEAGGRKVRALLLSAAFLMLVTVWAWLFFYWHVVTAAGVVSGFATLLAVGATWAAFKARRSAGWLMVAPLIWTVYLTALNLALKP